MAQHTTHVTTDHDEIRRWAEERGARPARVKGTGGNGDPGIIRLDFPDYTGEDTLEEISWDEWFRAFDENGLALVYQDRTASGEKSNFNKLVSRETVEASKPRGASASKQRGPAASKQGSSASTKRGSTASKRSPAASKRSPAAAKRSAATSKRSAATSKRSAATSKRSAATSKGSPAASKRSASASKRRPSTSTRSSHPR